MLKALRHLCVPVALTLLASPALAQSEGNLTFVSGGVGIDARQKLADRESEFNFKLVTAMEGSGYYLAGANVKVIDGTGAELLQTTMDGPWLLADLPPGKYTVEATYDGEAITKEVAIPESGHREAYFYWDIAADGLAPAAQASS